MTTMFSYTHELRQVKVGNGWTAANATTGSGEEWMWYASRISSVTK